jgi:hypothetical protein
MSTLSVDNDCRPARGQKGTDGGFSDQPLMWLRALHMVLNTAGPDSRAGLAFWELGLTVFDSHAGKLLQVARTKNGSLGKCPRAIA